MIEIECPTCETRFSVMRKVEVGDKVECPECGELLRVASVSPLEVEYWEEEEEEEEEEDYTAAEDSEELLELGEEFSRGVNIEDEENENFELPDKSSFMNETEENDEEEEGGDEEEEY